MENYIEILPDEILIKIFNYLDNNSMWKAMNICKQWTEIFENSSMLMNKFVMKVDKEFISKTNFCDNLPDVPIKNVILNDTFSLKSSKEPFVKVVEKYQKSITKIEFFDFKFNLNEFVELLEPLQELTHLQLNNTDLIDQDSTASDIILPKLKSLTIVLPTYQSFGDPLGKLSIMLFKQNKNIDTLILKGYNNLILSDHNLHEFLTHIPNLKHLDLSSKFYLNQNLPCKLETLKIYSIEPNNISFMRKQKENLKYVHMQDHPRDSEIYKFIFDEMKLEKLTVAGLELISKGKVQKIDKLTLMSNLESGLNLLQRCGPIKDLSIGLNDYTNREFHLLSIQPTSCFANLEKLQIYYYSCDPIDFTEELLTFFNKCSGIKILHFQIFRNTKSLDCLKTMLTCFPDLEELKIDWPLFDSVEAMCKVIKKNCRKIKTLIIREKYKFEARRYFFFRKLVAIITF